MIDRRPFIVNRGHELGPVEVSSGANSSILLVSRMQVSRVLLTLEEIGLMRHPIVHGYDWQLFFLDCAAATLRQRMLLFLLDRLRILVPVIQAPLIKETSLFVTQYPVLNLPVGIVLR